MNNLGKNLYTLIPIENFKAIMSVDDRDEKTVRFCLLTSSLRINQYCKRRFIRKKYTENFQVSKDLFFPLREYPVTKILAVTGYQAGTGNTKLIDPIFYRPMIGCGLNEELPFELLLSNSLKPYNFSTVKISYWAGYKLGSVPADLASACLELASWNMNRFKGKRIGMSGNIRGAGVQGEHFEMSMPENVKSLLEPYRRKTI
jgi:hypothetical protein